MAYELTSLDDLPEEPNVGFNTLALSEEWASDEDKPLRDAFRLIGEGIVSKKQHHLLVVSNPYHEVRVGASSYE